MGDILYLSKLSIRFYKYTFSIVRTVFIIMYIKFISKDKIDYEKSQIISY